MHRPQCEPAFVWDVLQPVNNWRFIIENVYLVLGTQGTEDSVTRYGCNKVIKQMLLEDYDVLRCHFWITILNAN